MAAPRQGLPVRLERAPHRGAAFAITRASRRARTRSWSANLPVTQRIEIDGFRIYVLHILAELDPQAADNVDAVIYGHSHQPQIETKNGTLFFNPGSAGPRRFREKGITPSRARARGRKNWQLELGNVAANYPLKDR